MASTLETTKSQSELGVSQEPAMAGSFDPSAHAVGFENVFAENSLSNLAVDPVVKPQSRERGRSPEKPAVESIPAATDTVKSLVAELDGYKQAGVVDQYRLHYDGKSLQVELLNKDKYSGRLEPWKDDQGQPYTKETLPAELQPLFAKVEQLSGWLKAGKNPELLKALRPELYEKSPTMRFMKWTGNLIGKLFKLREPAQKHAEQLPAEQKERYIDSLDQEIAIGQRRTIERGEEYQVEAQKLFEKVEDLTRIQLDPNRASERYQTMMPAHFTSRDRLNQFGRVEPYIQPYFAQLGESYKAVIAANGDFREMRDQLMEKTSSNRERIAELERVMNWVETADANRERTAKTLDEPLEETTKLIDENAKLQKNYESLMEMMQTTNATMAQMSKELADLKVQATTGQRPSEQQTQAA